MQTLLSSELGDCGPSTSGNLDLLDLALASLFVAAALAKLASIPHHDVEQHEHDDDRERNVGNGKQGAAAPIPVSSASSISVPFASSTSHAHGSLYAS